MRLAVATKKVDAIRSWTAHEAYRSPSWSPDGSNIAYETLDSASAQLVVTDLDHARTRSLVALSDITAFRHITWSPTGKKILYNDSENELYTIWADGSHRSTISDGDSYDGSWSPDGTNIVFIEDPADDRLSVSRSDGSIAYIPLAVPAGTLSAPEWSSDAQQIAFRVNGVKGGLFSIDLRTHAVTKVASGSVDDFSWQPQKR